MNQGPKKNLWATPDRLRTNMGAAEHSLNTLIREMVGGMSDGG
jgi:hypothetical protein